MKTSEGNKIIAHFMGKNYFNYHCSWEDLMNVIDRIEALQVNDEYVYFTIFTNAVTIGLPKETILIINKCEAIGPAAADWMSNFQIKKESAWEAIVAFIQWYNTK